MLLSLLLLASVGVLQTHAAGSLSVGIPYMPVQCQPFLLTWSGGTPPYTVNINEPSSLTKVHAYLTPKPLNATSITWIVDIRNGSSFILAVTDAAGTKRYSDTTVVRPNKNNDDACLSQSSSSSSSHSKSSSSSANPAIIGGAVGGGVALLAIATFLFIFYRRRRRQADPTQTRTRERDREASSLFSVDGEPKPDQAQTAETMPHPWTYDQPGGTVPAVASPLVNVEPSRAERGGHDHDVIVETDAGGYSIQGLEPERLPPVYASLGRTLDPDPVPGSSGPVNRAGSVSGKT